MDKLYMNYLYDQIFILKDKIAKTESESKKKYYNDIIESLQKRIDENK